MSKTTRVEGNDHKLMSLPECANYLHLSETTVLKLAIDNKLPGVLAGKKWQFQRELVDEWLQERLALDSADGLEEIPDPMRVPLGDLLPETGVLGDLKSTDPLNVIEELAALPYNQGWLHDKPWFVGAVVERETLASTALEGGVAFLHTRSREANRIARPFIIVGRSYQGVDFGAPDGRPTFLFFMLGLKYDRLHLPILGRLARTMLNPMFIAKLRAQPSAAKIRALLLKEDARALAENKQVPVHYEAFKPKLDRQMRLRAIMRLNAVRKHEAKKAQEAEKKAKTRKKGARAEAAVAGEVKVEKNAGKVEKNAGKVEKNGGKVEKRGVKVETRKKSAKADEAKAKTPPKSAKQSAKK